MSTMPSPCRSQSGEQSGTTTHTSVEQQNLVAVDQERKAELLAGGAAGRRDRVGGRSAGAGVDPFHGKGEGRAVGVRTDGENESPPR